MSVYPNSSIVQESEREYHPYHQYGDVLFVSNESLYFKTDGRRLAKERLMDQPKTIPWRALVIASHRDDRKLGAKALRSMERDTFLRDPDWRGKIWDLVLEDNTTNATVTRMVPRKWKNRRRIWHTDSHAEVTKERVSPFRDDWNDFANRFQQDDW
ncbi:uncharacterized protein L199_000695 [Kwoniella botswanensis]|uniref:uncharacterized protein n=1 Tax=Kwoniella botswanensis TaxID=1268659 RepID=UPI00315DCB9B